MAIDDAIGVRLAAVEVDEILREGASLAAVDAEALENRLAQRPYDLETRARLLGYYEARGREAFKATTMQGKISFGPGDSARRETLARHALWLAANAPRSPLAAHPLLHFSTREPVYAELSSIWRRQVAAEPPDATVLANAIAFFWWPNDLYADELLARARGALPGRWALARASAEQAGGRAGAAVQVPGARRRTDTSRAVTRAGTRPRI